MSYEWGNGRKGAAIEVCDVDLKRVPLKQRMNLIRALHQAEADPDCVCSWLHNPIKASITYTVVGPEAKVEAFKQAAMTVVRPAMVCGMAKRIGPPFETCDLDSSHTGPHSWESPRRTQ